MGQNVILDQVIWHCHQCLGSQIVVLRLHREESKFNAGPFANYDTVVITA